MTMRMTATKILTGVAALVLVGSVAVGSWYLPDPQRAVQSVPITSATSGSLSLTCTGNVQRLIKTGVNVDDADEKITSWVGGYLTGAEESDESVYARFETFDTFNSSQKKSQEGSDSEKLAKGISGEISGSTLNPQLASPTNIKQSELNGAIILDRAIDDLPFVVAGNAHRASAGDLRGVANNPCMWPQSSAWLVGGTTLTGASNQLVLANPTGNTIQATLEAYGASGSIIFRGNPVVNVPALSVQKISLDGLLGEHERVALHITAPSGRFVASWETTQLDGYIPFGVDFITPAVQGTEITVPGIILPSAPISKPSIDAEKEQQDTENTSNADSGNADYSLDTEAGDSFDVHTDLVADGYSATLRLVNPSDHDARVSTVTIGADGKEEALPGGTDITIASQAVLDLTLDGLPAGAFAVRTRSDTPIVAAVQVSQEQGAGRDFAWLPSSSPISQGGAAFGLISAQLVATAVQDKTQMVWHAYDASGKEIGSETELVSGTVAIDMPSDTHYVMIDAKRPVWAAISGRANLDSQEGGIDSLPLLPAAEQRGGSAIAFTN